MYIKLPPGCRETLIKIEVIIHIVLTFLEIKLIKLLQQRWDRKVLS